MATVYRARMRQEGPVGQPGEVAIKVLHAHYLNDLGFRVRFEEEARLIAGLQHTAIVPVLPFGQFEQHLYIVTAYLPNGSLVERLYQGAWRLRRRRLRQAMDILARVAVALDYAHGKGVVHRDLKPSNVLFDARDQAYPADFGIARQAGAGRIRTSTISGTPAYMSPEQAQGEGEVGAASDRYALAVLAY